MSKCPYEDRIDLYVRGAMEPKEQEEFEKHYFDCESCFSRLMETYEVVRVLKDGKAFDVSASYEIEGPRRERGWRRWCGFLKRKR